jgi:hypothetical protein
MATTKNVRIATTITTVVPGSYGARFAHNTAAWDAVGTALDQADKAQEAGTLSQEEAREVRKLLSQAGDILFRRLTEAVDADVAKAKEAGLI